MATRSPSNKGSGVPTVDKRNNAVPPPARNTQNNTQAVRRMPDVAYGEQQALTEQQKAAPLPKDTMPQAQPMRRRMPEVDVFAQTQRPTEPVTSGLPFGAGPGAEEPLENTNDIIYEMYRLTGDSYLLNLIDQ